MRTIVTDFSGVRIFVDDDLPIDIQHHTDNKVFCALDFNDDNLYKVSEKLWNKSKELARKKSGEAEWTEALYTAIDELKPDGLEIARNRGKLAPYCSNTQPC